MSRRARARADNTDDNHDDERRGGDVVLCFDSGGGAVSPLHTRGPWAYALYEGSGIASVGHVGAYVFGPDCGSPEMACYDDHGDEEADARLCAAAPDLLAAVHGLLAVFNCRDFEPGDSPTVDIARAAIAKATKGLS